MSDEEDKFSVSVVDPSKEIDLDDDYKFARQTYYDLLAIAMEALPALKELAEDSEHPRAYEVLMNGIKHTGDLTDKFLEHQRRKQVLDADGKRTPEPQALERDDENGAILFTGSVKELQEKLKNES